MQINAAQHLATLLIYLLITLVMTLPVALNLTTHIAGGGGDPWQTLWRFQDTSERLQGAIASGGLAEFAAAEFFGGGEPRLVNLSAWPWLWLSVLVGQPAVYNLIWLLSFVLSGYTMYLLARFVLGSAGPRILIGRATLEIAPLLAGLYYMFVPYHVAHSLGHFGAMQPQWLPLLILLGLLAVARPTVWRVVAFVAVFTVQVWTEHHYALWFGITALVAAAVYYRRWSHLRRRSGLPYLALTLVLILLFSVLSYAPTIRLAGQATAPLDLGINQVVRFSADSLSFVAPSPFHPLWGGAVRALFSEHFTGNISEATQSLGIIPLLLLLFFHQKIPRQQFRWWVCLAVLFFIISLGPQLHVLGTVTRIPLPYAVITNLPVFSAVRAIGRAGVMVALSVAILVGWFVHTQVNRRWVATTLAAVLLGEFLFLPVALQPAGLSAVYDEVRRLPGASVVELPAATNYTAASRALYASHLHGKTVIGSHALERAGGQEQLLEARSLPALRQLLYLRTSHLRENREDFLDQDLTETLPDTLRWLDVGAIIIHTDSLSLLQTQTMRTFLEDRLGLTAQSFGDVLLYPVVFESLPGSDGVFVARDDGWQHVGLADDGVTTVATLVDEASLTVYNVTERPQTVELVLPVDAESGASVLLVTSGGITREFTAEGGERLTVQLTVDPGSQVLTFRNRVPEPAKFRAPTVSVSP